MNDLTGQTFGQYHLIEKLGEGGMAEVYKAYQSSLERHVALKFIRPELAEQEGFRPRFEQEAKLLARLSHPHIVHVYDFGEAEGRPYLVMEYVAGGTLKDRLRAAREQDQTFPFETTLDIAQQVSDALDYAHAQDIIHRDIKPANIMFTPEGRVLLNDFGLAKLAGRTSDLSQMGGATSGTPDYMAPEQVSGDAERVGPASDRYALGVVLYEMLTGRVPFLGDSSIAVMLKHISEPPPSPRELKPELPEPVTDVLLKALAKDPAERYDSANVMALALREALGLAVEPAPRLLDEMPAPGEPPFKGLQYFDEADADLFFGREQWVAKLLQRLREHRFLAVVVGASGSGKSSIVRAGLVPALRQNGEYGPIHILTPTAHPLEAIALSLTHDSESITAATTLIDDLRRDARSLHLFTRRMMKNGHQRLVLVVDQFEELFTLCHDEAERVAFVDNLMTATAPEMDGATTVVITLRADFYAHCAHYANLREAVARHQEYIGPMSADDLRRAIEEPARRGGWELEPGLVDTLLKDVGDEPGALPLLSHALLETWKRRRGRTLTLRGYAEAGGVRGAIAKTAETVYQNLSSDQQALARSIFLRLTELGEGTQDTRRRASLDELTPRPEEADAVRAVLKVLVDARLVITDDKTAEVAHEALIREWPTLREWLNENREGLRLHRQLTQAAHDWLRLNRDDGALYRGARLAQVVEWAEWSTHGDEPNALEREFLLASKALAEHEEAEREAQRQRELEGARKLTEMERQTASRLQARNRIITAIGTLAVVAAIGACLLGSTAGFFGVRSSQSAATAQVANTQAVAEANKSATSEALAEEQRDEAQRQLQIAFSRQLAAQAISHLDDQLDLSLLLSLEASRVANTLEAQGSLLESLRYNPGLSNFLYGHSDLVMGVAFSPDGHTLASGGLDGRIMIWDVKTTQPRLVASQQVRNYFLDVAFNMDGSVLVAGGASQIYWWDIAHQIFISRELAIEGTVYNLVFSPNNRTLASVICTDTDCGIQLWDATMLGASTETITITERIWGVAFGPDSRTLALGVCRQRNEEYQCSQSEVLIWNLVTHEWIGPPLSAPNTEVSKLVFSPDGRTLVLGTCGQRNDEHQCIQGEILFWNVATRNWLGQSLKAHTGETTVLAFSHDGRFLVSHSNADHKTILWDPATGQLLSELVTNTLIGTVRDVFFSSDDRFLISSASDMTLAKWDISDPLEPKLSQSYGPLSVGHSEWGGLGIVPSPNEQFLAMIGGSRDTGGIAVLWDMSATDGILAKSLVGHDVDISNIAFSPDGKLLASGSSDGTVILWDIQSSQPTSVTFTVYPSNVTSLAFSPDSQILALGSADKTITLWDVATHQPIGQPLVSHTNTVESLVFSPNGQILVSRSLTEHVNYQQLGQKVLTLIFWDVSNGQIIGQISSDEFILSDVGHSPYSLAMSPDGRLLATAGAGIALWNMDTRLLYGERLRSPRRSAFLLSQFAPFSVAFSADNTTLATGMGDGTVILWNLTSSPPHGELMLGLHGTTLTHVTSVSFSPDGHLLASGGNGSVLLWDVARRQTFGQPFSGQSAVFSPDSKTLAIVTDNRITLWNIDNDSWQSLACQRAGRNLTKVEWNQYMGDEPYHKTCGQWPEGE